MRGISLKIHCKINVHNGVVLFYNVSFYFKPIDMFNSRQSASHKKDLKTSQYDLGLAVLSKKIEFKTKFRQIPDQKRDVYLDRLIKLTNKSALHFSTAAHNKHLEA